MKVNLNSLKMKVRLTDRGKKILRENHFEMVHDMPGIDWGEFELPEEDEEGFSTWSVSELFNTFGKYVFMGSNLPFWMDVEIIEE